MIVGSLHRSLLRTPKRPYKNLFRLAVSCDERSARERQYTLMYARKGRNETRSTTLSTFCGNNNFGLDVSDIFRRPDFALALLSLDWKTSLEIIMTTAQHTDTRHKRPDPIINLRHHCINFAAPLITVSSTTSTPRPPSPPPTAQRSSSTP